MPTTYRVAQRLLTNPSLSSQTTSASPAGLMAITGWAGLPVRLAGSITEALCQPTPAIYRFAHRLKDEELTLIRWSQTTIALPAESKAIPVPATLESWIG